MTRFFWFLNFRADETSYLIHPRDKTRSLGRRSRGGQMKTCGSWQSKLSRHHLSACVMPIMRLQSRYTCDPSHFSRFHLAAARRCTFLLLFSSGQCLFFSFQLWNSVSGKIARRIAVRAGYKDGLWNHTDLFSWRISGRRCGQKVTCKWCPM